MKREDFILKISELFGKDILNPINFDNANIHFEIKDQNPFQMKEEFGEYLHSNILSHFGLPKLENSEILTLLINSISGHEQDVSVSINLNPNFLFDVLLAENLIESPKMKVYRLENENDEGIYSTLLSKYDLDTCSSTPSPLEDTVLKSIFRDREEEDYLRKWHFGFNSIEQLNNWFAEEFLDAALDAGAIVKIYEIEQGFTLSTNHQTAFVKDNSEFVEEYPLSELHNSNKQTQKNTTIKAQMKLF